jgi:hypothetical protein
MIKIVQLQERKAVFLSTKIIFQNAKCFRNLSSVYITHAYRIACKILIIFNILKINYLKYKENIDVSDEMSKFFL